MDKYYISMGVAEVQGLNLILFVRYMALQLSGIVLVPQTPDWLQIHLQEVCSIMSTEKVSGTAGEWLPQTHFVSTNGHLLHK